MPGPSAEPVVWNTVLFTDFGRLEDSSYYGVHVVWDESRNVVNLYEEGTITDPVLSIKDPFWEFTPMGFVIDGYIKRGVYRVDVELRMRPPGSGVVDPVRWKVEITDAESNELIDTCDPVEVVELDYEYEGHEGIRLQSRHHRRKLYWERSQGKDDDDSPSFGLDRLNRFQFTFRAATKHRGEEVSVTAVFSRSPVYPAVRLLTGQKA